MKVAIACGGGPLGKAVLTGLDGCRLVAADGGADALLAAGLMPEIVVGDMDSITPGALARLEEMGVPLERHPPDKDATDAELALAKALAMEPRPDEVLFVGALGRRLDHTLANLHLLRKAQKAGVRGRIVGEGEEVWLAGPGWPVEVVEGVEPGATVSLLPVSERASEVSTQGLKWELDEAVLEQGSTLGVSNVAVGGRFRVEVGEGAVLVVVRRGL